MPADVVIAAVEASILDITGQPNNLYHDMNNLLDFCGCLVKLSTDLPDEDDSLTAGRSRGGLLSLAHYTVKEYLEFLEQSSIGSNHLLDHRRNLNGDLVKVVLTTSQRQGFYDLTDFDDALYSSSAVWEFSQRIFGIYCTVSVIPCLQHSQIQAVTDDQIWKLIIQILHPSSVHFQTIKMISSVPDRNVRFDLFGERELYNQVVWYVDWSRFSGTEVRHIFNLTVFFYRGLPDVFSMNILQGSNYEEFINTEVSFFERQHCETWHFKGTLIEGLFLMTRGFNCHVNLLPWQNFVQRGIELSDPSKLLLHAAKGHEDCGPGHYFCVLLHLLKVGTDPDLPRYRVTPLQIAAARGDARGVEHLLEARANQWMSAQCWPAIWYDRLSILRRTILKRHT